MAVWLLVPTTVLLVLVGPASAARPRPDPCAGRYVIVPATTLLGTDGPRVEAVEVGADGRVSLGPCGEVSARRRVRRGATSLRAKWPSCADVGKVVLRARIAAPACDRLEGTVKRPGTPKVVFAAERVACGDGRLGPGEACDASATGGDATCPGLCVECACQPTSTTSTTTTTTTSSSSSTTTTLFDDGPPIQVPDSSWTWVDFPDSTCDDGSPTGLGVSFTGSPNLAIVLGLGGLCWDATTCWVQNTAVHGPFGPTQFANAVGFFAGSILDRTVPGNPLADWNLVTVPYCTGDVHAGNNVMMYDTGSAVHEHRHAGYANLLAFLRRLRPTFPNASKVVLAGISSGGFGTLFDFATVRARWPSAQAYLLDDSGPLIPSATFDDTFIASWFSSWRLDLVTDPLCGLACRDDLSLIFPALAALYPNDRMALVSSLQDAPVRNVFQLGPDQFEDAMLTLAVDRLEPTANFRYYLVPGQTHAQLANPAGVSVDGVPLLTWITRLVTDDPSWIDVTPP
jgi:hypothetical protein